MPFLLMQSGMRGLAATQGMDARVAQDEQLKDLEKLLADEKAASSMAKVAHLQAVVKW